MPMVFSPRRNVVCPIFCWCLDLMPPPPHVYPTSLLFSSMCHAYLSDSVARVRVSFQKSCLLFYKYALNDRRGIKLYYVLTEPLRIFPKSFISLLRILTAGRLDRQALSWKLVRGRGALLNSVANKETGPSTFAYAW